MQCSLSLSLSPVRRGPLLPVLLWLISVNTFDIWQVLTVKEVNLRERRGLLLYWAQPSESILILTRFSCAEGS